MSLAGLLVTVTGIVFAASAARAQGVALTIDAPASHVVAGAPGGTQPFSLTVLYDFPQGDYSAVSIDLQLPAGVYVKTVTQPAGWTPNGCPADGPELYPAHTCTWSRASFVSNEASGRGSFSVDVKLIRTLWVDGTPVPWSAEAQVQGSVVTTTSATTNATAQANLGFQYAGPYPWDAVRRDATWTAHPVTGEPGIAYDIEVWLRSDGNGPVLTGANGALVDLELGSGMSLLSFVPSIHWDVIETPDEVAGGVIRARYLGGYGARLTIYDGEGEGGYGMQLIMRVFVPCTQLPSDPAVAGDPPISVRQTTGRLSGIEPLYPSTIKVAPLEGVLVAGPAVEATSCMTPFTISDLTSAEVERSSVSLGTTGAAFYIRVRSSGVATRPGALIIDRLPRGVDQWRVWIDRTLYSSHASADNSRAQFRAWFCDLPDTTSFDSATFNALHRGTACLPSIAQNASYEVTPESIPNPTHIVFAPFSALDPSTTSWGEPRGIAPFTVALYFRVPEDYFSDTETQHDGDIVNTMTYVDDTLAAQSDTAAIYALDGSIIAIGDHSYWTAPREIHPDNADPCAWVVFGLYNNAAVPVLNPSVVLAIADGLQNNRSRFRLAGTNASGTVPFSLFDSHPTCETPPTDYTWALDADNDGASGTFGSIAAPYGLNSLIWAACARPAVQICPEAGALLADGDVVTIGATATGANPREGTGPASATVNYVVRRAAQEQLTVTSECGVAGQARFVVSLQNTGGKLLTAPESGFAVPAAGRITAIDAPAAAVDCAGADGIFALCELPDAAGLIRSVRIRPDAPIPVLAPPDNAYVYRVDIAALGPAAALTGVATFRSAELGQAPSASDTFVPGSCPGTLRVVAFADDDGDGLETTGEARLAGWVFDVFGADPLTPLATLTSDGGGEAALTLPEGSYTVRLRPVTAPPDGSVTTLSTVDGADVMTGADRQVNVPPDATVTLAAGNSCACEDSQDCRPRACAFEGASAACTISGGSICQDADGETCTAVVCVDGECEAQWQLPAQCAEAGDAIFFGAVRVNGGDRSVRCVIDAEGTRCDVETGAEGQPIIGPRGQPLLKLGPPMCGQEQ